MKKICLALCVVPSSLLLNGCASAPSETHRWTIEPKQSVHHATNRPDGFYQLGRYYQGQDRFEQAHEAYRKALEVDPNFTEAHNALGTVYASQGKHEEALAEFNAAAVQMPNAAHIQNNIGYLNFLKGNYADAVAAFTKATALDKTDQKAWNNLALALAKIDKPAESNQAFTQALETKPSVTPSASNDTQQEPVALALPKDRGVIVYAANGKNEKETESQSDLNKLPQDQPTEPVKISSSLPAPAFAVLAKVNPAAMPEIIISEEAPSAGEKAGSTSKRTSEGKISALPAAKKPALVESPSPAATSYSYIANPAPVQQVAIATPAASDTRQQTGSAKADSRKESPPAVASLAAFSTSSMAQVRNFALQVVNGNGINRLAAKFRSILSAEGFPKARLANLKPFNQPQTVIYYRAGYHVEAAQLRDHLSKMNKGAFSLTESKQLPSYTDVKIVLGKDTPGRLMVTSSQTRPQT